MDRRRFYLLSIVDSEYNDIVGMDAIHISRVLRIKVGEFIEIFDGLGKEYLAKIIYVSSKLVKVKIIKNIINNSESPISITVAQAILKDKKMNTIIRQLTEIGIDRWIPFNSSRSVPILNNNRLIKKIEKWKKISIEAIKQCRRGILPEIYFLEDFDKIFSLSKPNNINIIFWEKGLEGLKHKLELYIRNKSCPNHMLVVIGPEGGFELDEIKKAKNKGFYVSSLGPRILRAETASIVACSIIQYVFGDLGKKS